ncbi:MAG: AI-2E family transporter [Patescibacteria group bacterium]|nr:AI-2E family transporter [Patescibacteria group bacterium]
MAESEKFQHYFFVGLLTLIIGVNILIFLPYLGPLVFSMTLAVVFAPLYKWILKSMPSFPSTAALMTMLLVFVVIFIPFMFFGALVIQQAQHLYGSLAGSLNSSGFLNNLSSALQGQFSSSQSVNLVVSNINEYSRIGLQYIVSNASGFFSATTNVAIQVVLMLMALFFFLRDGANLRKLMARLSPLPDEDDELVFSRLETAINSIVKGSVLLSLLQGVIAAFGFLLFGVPNAAFWGAVTFLAAFLPGVGTAVVILSAALYLYFESTLGVALGMVLWGVLILVIDNLVRPQVIAEDTGMHPLLIFLSIFGGANVFGGYGLLLGPLLLSFMFALTGLYKKELGQQ